MGDISSLQVPDRIEIFRHLAVDEFDKVRLDIFDSIAGNHFHEFLKFCDKVFKEKDKINSVSCTLEDDRLQFNIDYKTD